MNNNSPVRILQVLGELNTGGAESLVMNVYRNIDRNLIQFDFVVHGINIGFYENEIKKLGGRVFHISKYKGINHFKYVKEWENFFRVHSEYKIIHSHIRSTASLLLKVAKKYNLITICHSHNTSNGKGISSIVKKIYQKNIPKYADYLYACSKESAIWLYGEELANSKKCIIFNNAIDSDRYIYNSNIRAKVRESLNIDKRIVLGQVGRLTEQKNYFFSLKLLHELVNINSKYILLIIGVGPLKEKIVNYINNNNLNDYVIILENRSDVNELMQAMDTFIMPSLWEGLPLSLVEAQAASLPCIISNHVTDGIIIKEKVKTLSLDFIDTWINTIEKIRKIDIRVNESKRIKESGFSIQQNTELLCDFYLKLLK